MAIVKAKVRNEEQEHGGELELSVTREETGERPIAIEWETAGRPRKLAMTTEAAEGLFRDLADSLDYDLEIIV